MKKRKNLAAKVVAFISLFGILLGTFSVGLTFILEQNNAKKEQELNAKVLAELLQKYDANENGKLDDDEFREYAKDAGINLDEVEASTETETPSEEATDSEVKDVVPTEEEQK